MFIFANLLYSYLVVEPIELNSRAAAAANICGVIPWELTSGYRYLFSCPTGIPGDQGLNLFLLKLAQRVL
jgi:hypothetical protein